MMRINIVIDDDLMESALKVSGLKTKEDAIEERVEIAGASQRSNHHQGFLGKTQMEWQSG